MANPPTANIPSMNNPNVATTIYIGGFKVTRRGRFWVVKDPDGLMVCVAVYKKGALEVVRRLLPPDLCHLIESNPQWAAPRQQRVLQSGRRYDPNQK